MKFYRIVSCLLIIPILTLTSGCASYRFGRLPSPYINDHPTPVTQQGVSVATEFLGCTKGDSTFDCELTKKKVTPVFIVIENKSEVAYNFKKTDVDPNHIPAEAVAKKCARSTMKRLLGYGFLVLCPYVWIIFLPMLIAEMVNCPSINSRMKNDYITNEIADTTIAPGRSVSGVMFVSLLSNGKSFNIPLTNKSTEEKLVFSFQVNLPVVSTTETDKQIKQKTTEKQEAEVILVEQKKLETETNKKETSKPKQNFGPRTNK